LRYNWPIWFAENYNGILSQGQMVDICSGGASFTCYADKCPYPGGKITARFSVPRYDSDESFDMENFIRDGRVCRIEEQSPFIRRIAMQFAESLPFKPGEFSDTEALAVDPLISSDKETEAERLAEQEAAAMAGELQQSQSV